MTHFQLWTRKDKCKKCTRSKYCFGVLSASLLLRFLFFSFVVVMTSNLPDTLPGFTVLKQCVGVGYDWLTCLTHSVSKFILHVIKMRFVPVNREVGHSELAWA